MLEGSNHASSTSAHSKQLHDELLAYLAQWRASGVD